MVRRDLPITSHIARRSTSSARASRARGSRSPTGSARRARASSERWNERPGARIRRVRPMGKQPLQFLYDVHPEARLARPVEVGLQTIDVDEIAGTAVGGGAQRGGDFLPLKPFRGANWASRWQRLRRAQDGLAVLPPIDVVKSGDATGSSTATTGSASRCTAARPPSMPTSPSSSRSASAGPSRSARWRPRSPRPARSGPPAAATDRATRCRTRTRPASTRRTTGG